MGILTMFKFCSTILIGIVLAIFIFVGSSYAQEGSFKLGRVEFHPAFKMDYKYDDNIFLETDSSFPDGSDDERPTEDQIFTPTASLSIEKPREKGELMGFELSYELKKEIFYSTSAEDATEHNTKGKLKFGGPGERATVNLLGNYRFNN